MALVERAAGECGKVAVSVFVNPKQFGPQEDFSRYPRPFRRDAALCRSSGVHLLYHPGVAEIYPPGFDSSVDVKRLSAPLCGRDGDKLPSPLWLGSTGTPLAAQPVSSARHSSSASGCFSRFMSFPPVGPAYRGGG